MYPPVKIVKNRSDIGAGTRGSDLGVDALEVAAINQQNSYFNDLPYIDVESYNETIYNKVTYLFAKRIQYVYGQCVRIAEAVTQTINEGHFPIVLSGDHSSSLGTISGVKAAHPDQQLGVIWIDAHADLHSPYTSPSGNIHGMPLAAALGEDNLECKINNLTKATDHYWSRMKAIGGEGPKVRHSDVVFFGVRDTEEPEDQLIARQGIRNFTVPEVRFRGIDTCLKEALEIHRNCDSIYISFDVDSLDCDRVSYGTGTPVPNGFNPDEVSALINGLIGSGKISCLEIVEINPLLDTKGNRMAETAFEILNAATRAIQCN